MKEKVKRPVAICVWRGEGERKKIGDARNQGKEQERVKLTSNYGTIVDTGLYSKAAIVKYRR